MPQAVLIAALPSLIAGGGAVAGNIISSRANTGATKRSIAASDAAARRAEAATREEDALNRAEDARRDAEDKRRWEVEQANLTRRQAETDTRTAYEDAIRYGKMVNLARLTGQPVPPPPPRAGDALPTSPTIRSASDPLLSRPSTANATIPAPGAFPASPLDVNQPQRMPLSNLVGRRRVV